MPSENHRRLFWSRAYTLMLLVEELAFNTIQWLHPARRLTCSGLVILRLVDQTLEPLMWITSCTMSWSFVRTSLLNNPMNPFTFFFDARLDWSVCQHAFLGKVHRYSAEVGIHGRTEFQCCCLKLKPQNQTIWVRTSTREGQRRKTVGVEFSDRNANRVPQI